MDFVPPLRPRRRANRIFLLKFRLGLAHLSTQGLSWLYLRGEIGGVSFGGRGGELVPFNLSLNR